MACIVGIVGRNGSGKDEVADYLKRSQGFAKISIGDIVRDIAETKGIEPSRENLQKVAEKYRAQYGREYFARQVVQKIEQNGWQNVAATGMRTPADVSVFKTEFGKDFLLVHVAVSDPRTRFASVKKRGEPRDPNRYDDFLDQDRKEEERFHLTRSIEQADVIVSNDGTLEAFHREIERKLAGRL